MQQLPEGFELVPDGFELVTDSIPEGFEVVPDGYELVDESPNRLEQFARNVGGSFMGAADIASSSLTAIPLWLKAQTDVALGGDPAKEREEMYESMSKLSPSATVKALTGEDPRENQSYQYLMKPFELAGEGIEAGVEALGGGPREQLAVEGLSMALPIPFLGKIGRGLGKVAETFDLGLRNVESGKPAPLRSEPSIPAGFEEVPLRESTSGNVTVRWEEQPMAQADMFETINPYDVGGGVTDAMAGRERVIDPLAQQDMFTVEQGVDVPGIKYEATGTGLDQYGNPTGDFIQISDYVPQSVQELPQQFRKAIEDVPGLKKAIPEAVSPEPPMTAGEPPAGRNKPVVERATEKIPGLNKEMQMRIFEDQPPEYWVDIARQERDGSGSALAKYGSAGANLASQTRQSSLVKGVYTYWNEAENKSRVVWNKDIIPVERQLAKLTKEDRQALGEMMKGEMFKEARNPEALNTLSPKAQEAYASLRNALQQSGEVFNRGRAAAGLEPVSLNDYYLSSRWHGNFKMEVRDKDGNLLWYLREPSQRSLNNSAEALKAKFPDLVYKEIPAASKHQTKVDQLEAGYLDMLKLLDENDARVEALKSVYEEHIANEGQRVFGMPFHAEHKGNIRGFIGDKPNRKPLQNATELLNSQIQYMKNTAKWAAQQEAAAKVKKIISDPVLQKTQPNNVEYAKEYSKNALGFGTQQDIRNLETGLSRMFGVDREVAMTGLNYMRSYFYTKNLGLLNPKAMFVQLAQPLFMIPAHLDMKLAGFDFNPVKAYAQTIQDTHALWNGKKLRPEIKEALDYARENGILSINVLEDIKDIGQSDLARKAQHLANINQVKAEEIGRTVSFVGAINHLHESGLRGETLYRTAEAMVNRVMVDYRKFEQPMWMEKAGMMGRAAGTLKTFLNNQYHQLIYYSDQALKGLGEGKPSKVAPLASLLAIQYFLGGNLGMYGVNTAAETIDSIMQTIGGPKNADFSVKAKMLENFSDTANYGLFSKLTGANMHGSLSQGTIAGSDSIGEMLFPFMSDITKTAGATAKAVINPTNENAVSGAVYENLPPHLKGAMENLYGGFTSPSGVSLNPRDPEVGMYRRSDYEKALRFLGATSLDEMATKDRAWTTQQIERNIGEAKQVLQDNFVQAARNQNKDKQKEIITTLSRWMGPDEIERYLVEGLTKSFTNRNRTVDQRLLPPALDTIQQQLKYLRVRRLNNGQE